MKHSPIYSDYVYVSSYQTTVCRQFMVTQCDKGGIAT